MKYLQFIFIMILSVLMSCTDHTPKPMGYPRIDRNNVLLDSFSNKYFSFRYPSDARIESKKPDNNLEIWLDISYPQYNATIHCTYLPISKQSLPKVLEDNYRLAYGHAAKAESINQIRYNNPRAHTYGILYDIGGSVAVPVQFFITDSISHFFRGSLYYNVSINNTDSIEPVTDFLRHDITTIMSTMTWGRVGMR